MSFILPIRSLRFRALMFVWSPTPWLPPLFSLRAEHARVGSNCTDYALVRVSFK